MIFMSYHMLHVRNHVADMIRHVGFISIYEHMICRISQMINSFVFMRFFAMVESGHGSNVIT